MSNSANTIQGLHLPNCHNCLQFALYQLEQKQNIPAAIAALKSAQLSLNQLRSSAAAIHNDT